jgi:tetratricopeptide (TPR) repeat protein
VPTSAKPRHVRSGIGTFLTLCFFIAPCWALAHDSPATVISQLTETMADDGVSADLFFRRASEFRAIRYYQRAAYDLTQALSLDNTMVAARLELARLQLQNQGNGNRLKSDNPLAKDPLATIASLTLHEDHAIRAAAVALRGEIYLAKQQWQAAAADFTEALSVEPNLAWFLWRADAQMQLGLDDEAIDGLKIAYSVTQSPVVRKTLCDTYLAVATKKRYDGSDIDGFSKDSSYLEQAAKIIEEEIVENRLKSSWRIRSGKALMLRGDFHKAHEELCKALEELDARLETSHPDPALVQDQLTAQLLLAECTQRHQ